jgi:putative membrane protein
MNTELINYSALVVAKAKNEEVKKLGKMIEESHSKALSELTNLAKNKTITLPALASNDSNEEYKELNNKAANEFDEAYINKVIENHKEGIEKFEKASSSATDSDIKLWATNMLPTLRTHLDKALKCEKDLALMDDIKTRK